MTTIIMNVLLRLGRRPCGKALPFRLASINFEAVPYVVPRGVASILKIELAERHSLSARKAAELRTASTRLILPAFVQARRNNFCCRRARAGCATDGWRERVRNIANRENIRHIGF